MSNRPTRTEKAMKAKRPTKDVEITITITETVEGKLNIRASVPDHAAGTVASSIAAICMQGAQLAMEAHDGAASEHRGDEAPVRRERILEYARMLLGPVRFADKETRAQTVHTLHAMLNEEAHLCQREERHPRPPDPLKDSTRIDESYSLNARELAKAGILAPWKKKLAKVLGL